MPTEKRFKRIVYIGKNDSRVELWWVDEGGTRDYAKVFTDRPLWARFAILQDAEAYLCVDLHETTMHRDSLKIIMPKALVFQSMDAALMAAQLKL